MEKIGEITEEDLERVRKDLGPGEEIELITCMKPRKPKGRHHLVLTDRRAIFWKKGREKIVKETESYQDFLYPSISRVRVEPKKKFDLFKIETETGTEEEIMLPKSNGKRIAGRLRERQSE